MAKGKKTANEKYYSPFAKAIRKLMEENGTTQDELAEKTNRTRQTVSQYVNGISEPGYDTLVKIAGYFGVSTDFLLGRTETKTIDTTAQAVIEYTGLSEDNVRTLHIMKENPQKSLMIKKDKDKLCVDGCKPFLDLLNDVLDAIYFNKDVSIIHYIKLRQESDSECGFDPWYLVDGEFLNPLTKDRTTESGNEFVEYYAMKLARQIEESLKRKYTTKKEDM